MTRIVASDDKGLEGKTLPCWVLDVSVGGVRLSTDAMIPGGSTLDLMISLAPNPERFFLAGEVRWLTFDESGQFGIGVDLLESDSSDFKPWRAAIEQAIPE